jgi:hypothetical protein
VLDAGVRLPEKLQPNLQFFPRCAKAPSIAREDANKTTTSSRENMADPLPCALHGIKKSK